MKITSARYLTSVVQKEKIIQDDMTEVAFVGRSNVGKSSLINSLVGQKGLAKTSSTPGLTKMINYFVINEKFRIVDLPGYGYAQTGHKHIANWAGLMEEYLLGSKSLKSVFVLLDCRITPTELDKMMIDFLNSYQIPYVVVVTKCDKLAKSKISQACTGIAKTLGIRKEIIFAYSSENGFGKEKLLDYIENTI
ncbi:MAG: YihA family ribosome biogenesis GTP-binding protein [Clostridia bacterium]|nr:YihA family ribosome biogenesis GTP-binding protein [Clostridia bacterium]